MSQSKRSSPEADSSPVKPVKDGPAKTAARPPREQAVALAILNPHAAGIDVHSDMHMVCVPQVWG